MARELEAENGTVITRSRFTQQGRAFAQITAVLGTRKTVHVIPYSTSHGVYGWVWECVFCQRARGYCRDSKFLVVPEDWPPARIRALNGGADHVRRHHT